MFTMDQGAMMDNRTSTDGTLQHETQCAQAQQGRALTYRGYLGARIDFERGTGVRPVHVQFRKRGAVLCGVAIEGSPGQDGQDWFRVKSSLGVCSVPANNVRLCGGEGCSCEQPAASAGARAAMAAVCAVPLGNTGTTEEAGV